MPQLREFVYIDNESLNSNLSSLGKGIPSEITHSSEDQTEKGGGGGGRIAGIGAEGKYIKMDRNQIETTLDVTAPYRFQELIDEIEEQEIPILENRDPRGLSRSDLVVITGNVYPMSLLKISMALDAFGQFTGDEFNRALQILGETPIPSSDREEIEAISTFIEVISGSEYPIRIETDDNTYCTKLEQSYMRQSVFEAFGDNERYVLLGRVKRHIPGNQEWNPVNALDIMEQYMPDENMGEEFMEELRGGVEELNISIEDDDLRVRGHTAVIEPIALYW
ncbi:MAG: hypothetical protein U5J98_07030 [Halobacteriales archaeon]|nr:hypothetical protein [Halobacteriales archaeon]